VLIPLVSIPYISRVLDPAGLGKVSFIDSFTYYFISIAEFGIAVYGVREVAKKKSNKAELQTLVSELITLHIVSSSFAMVLYFISVALLWNKIHDIRLVLFSLSFLLVNFFTCEWYFRGVEKFRYITIRSLLTRVLGLISIFLVVNSTDDYYLYYGIIVISGILNSLWNTYTLFKALPINFKRVNWKKHIKHTWITYLISLSYGITLTLDNVLLGLVSTPYAVGLYAFSIKIYRTAGLILTDTLLVFFPRIVFLLKEGQVQMLKDTITQNLQLLMLFSLPLSIGLFLIAEPLTTVFLGAQFREAVTDVQILSIFPCLKCYNLFLGHQVLISHNLERVYFKNLITGSFIFVVLTLYLSGLYADVGASIAIIIGELIILVMNYYQCARLFPHYRLFFGEKFMQALGGSLLFIPIVYFIRSSGLSDLLILPLSIILCGVIYLLFQLFIIRDPLLQIVKNKILAVLLGKG
jgi:O-antigen/teichoic acid export membrane protein